MESAAPFYFVGALAGAEAGEGAGASMRLRLEQSAAQAQASRAPPAGAPAAGGAVPARGCITSSWARRPAPSSASGSATSATSAYHHLRRLSKSVQ